MPSPSQKMLNAWMHGGRTCPIVYKKGTHSIDDLAEGTIVQFKNGKLAKVVMASKAQEKIFKTKKIFKILG